jgi:hypothetical protein
MGEKLKGKGKGKWGKKIGELRDLGIEGFE